MCEALECFLSVGSGEFGVCHVVVEVCAGRWVVDVVVVVVVVAVVYSAPRLSWW